MAATQPDPLHERERLAAIRARRESRTPSRRPRPSSPPAETVETPSPSRSASRSLGRTPSPRRLAAKRASRPAPGSAARTPGIPISKTAPPKATQPDRTRRATPTPDSAAPPQRVNPLLVDAGAPTLNLTASGNPTPTAFLKQKLRLLKKLFRSGALDSPAGRREATRFEPFLFALLYMPQFFVLNIPTENDTPIGEYGGITLSQFHVDAFISGEEWSVAATQTRQDRDGWIAPRESGKSTIFFTVLPLWAAAHLHRRFIAAFSDSDDQVQKHLAKFHEQVDHNAALREDFPELCRPMRRANGNAVNDNKNEYTAESGFTFSAHTIDGKVVGLVNYENVRPDMLVLDDIEPSEDKYSVAMKNKGVNRLRDKILYLNEFARVVLVGTVTMAGSIMHDVVQSVLNPGHVPVEPTIQNPHRYGTLVPDWVREQNFRGHYYPALSIDPTTGALQSLWPEKWPVEELRPRLGTNDFMKNMQNNPVGDGDFWEQGDITYGHLAGTTVTLLTIDPAVTATATSDYTGLAVIRYQPGNASYDADEAAGRHHPPQPAPTPVPPEEVARRRAHRRGRRLPPNPTPADRARFVEGLLYQPYDDPTAGVPFTPTPLHTTTPEGALLPKAQSRCEVAWSNRVKMKPERLRLYVLSILERFPEISIILLETNQGHEFTAEPFKDLPVKLVVKNQTEPKDIRIARLAQYYKALDPRVTHAEHFLHLEEEMYAYPQTAHDDSIDAVATGCHYFLFKDPKSAKKRRPGPSVQHTTYLRRRGDTYDDWKVAA